MADVLRKVWFWHLIFWLAYLSFKVYHEFVWIYPKYPQLLPSSVFFEAIIAQLTMLPVKMVFSYWLIYALLPSKNKVWIKWIYFILGLTTAVVLYRAVIIHITLPIAYRLIPDKQPMFTLGYISSALIDILLVMGFGATLVLYHQNKVSKEKADELEKEKIASELQFLKQQTNPHFLFNTLNNLYALARKNASQTADAILQLSKLMRFVLYESSYASIPLQKEVEIIRDYINLEKLRFGTRLKLNLDIQEKLEGQISPLLLLPLVENAFKHGAGESEEDPFVSITLTINEGILSLVVNNNRPLKNQGEFKQGIGLKNLKRQLCLQYPEHRITTDISDNVYTVALQLNLTNAQD